MTTMEQLQSIAESAVRADLEVAVNGRYILVAVIGQSWQKQLSAHSALHRVIFGYVPRVFSIYPIHTDTIYEYLITLDAQPGPV